MKLPVFFYTVTIVAAMLRAQSKTLGSDAQQDLSNETQISMLDRTLPESKTQYPLGPSVRSKDDPYSPAAPLVQDSLRSCTGFFRVGCFHNSAKYVTTWYHETVPERQREEMSAKVCFSFCQRVPYSQYFGVHNGDQCWCANFYDKAGTTEGHCDLPCVGNHGEICGGQKLSTIYEMHDCNNLPAQKCHGSPPPISHAQTMCEWGDTAKHSYCPVDCMPGYDLDHNKIECKEFGDRLVFSWGSWVGTAACVPKNCGPPANVPHTRHSRSDVYFPNSVGFQCQLGFSLDRAPQGPRTFEQTCQEDGRLTAPKQCLAVRCGPAPVQDRACRNYMLMVTAAGATRNSTSQHCFDAAKEEKPQELFFMDEAFYSCVKGYTLDAVASGPKVHSRQCTATGEFTAAVKCRAVICGAAPMDRHAQVLGDFAKDLNAVIQYPVVVPYKCNPGHSFDATPKYEADNTAFGQQCTEHGTFRRSSGACRPVDCGMPPDVSNSLVRKAPLTFSQKAFYECATGYSVNGKADGPKTITLTCGLQATFENDDGVEHSAAPKTCQPVECGTPPRVDHALVQRSEGLSGVSVFPEVMILKGLPGYSTTISDDPFTPASAVYQVSCRADGTFSPTPPMVNMNDCLWHHCGAHGSCRDLETPRPDPDDNYVCDCNAGYEVRRNENNQKRCRNINDCPVENPCDGQGACTDLLMAYKCECDRGFEQVEMSLAGNVTCAPILSGVRETVRNADVVVSHKYTFPADAKTQPTSNMLWTGSEAKYTCQTGYTTDGSPAGLATFSVFGTDKGSMTARTHVCQPVICPADLLEVANSQVTTAVNQLLYVGAMGRVSYTCDTGYTLTGVAGATSKFERSCEADGSMKCHAADGCVCKAVACPALPTVDNAKEVECEDRCGVARSFPESVFFKCDQGWSTTGDASSAAAQQFSFECLSTGAYSKVASCQRVVCGVPPLAPHQSRGADKTTRAVFEQQTEYTCDEGYTLDGKADGAKSYKVICQADGTFSPTQACRPVQCGAPDSAPHATVPGVALTFGQEATYACHTGYSLDGFGNGVTSYTRKCGANGSFSKGKNCQPVQCGVFSPPEGATVSEAGVMVYGQRATVSCKPGYTHSGLPGGGINAEVSCQAVEDKATKLGPFSSVPLCVNIDDCNAFGVSCGTRGKCVDNPVPTGDHSKDYHCDCESGFKEEVAKDGTKFCGNIPDCPKGACNPGACRDLVNDYSCECPDGYHEQKTGKDRSCKPHVCGNAPTMDHSTASRTGVVVFPEVVTYTCENGYTLDGSAAGQRSFDRSCKASASTKSTATQAPWTKVVGMYSGNYPRAGKGVDSAVRSLEESKIACSANPDCKAVTCAGGNVQTCTLRRSETLKGSPSKEDTYAPKIEWQRSVGVYSGAYPAAVSGSGHDSTVRTLEESQVACLANPDCKAVTCARGNVATCTLRRSDTFKKSPTNEDTYSPKVGVVAVVSAAPVNYDFSNGHLGCKPVCCGATPAVAHATPAKAEATLKYGQKVQYTCSQGYTVDGTAAGDTVFSVQCEGTGHLAGVKPCQPAVCDTFPSVANAKFSTAPVAFGDNVTVRCLSGFSSTPEKQGGTEFDMACLGGAQFENVLSCSPVVCSVGAAPEELNAVYGSLWTRQPNTVMSGERLAGRVYLASAKARCGVTGPSCSGVVHDGDKYYPVVGDGKSAPAPAGQTSYIKKHMPAAAYKGCFKDAVDRDLPKLGRADGAIITRQEAQRLCAGYKYYGIQYTNQLFCGNSFGKHGSRDDCSCGEANVGAWRQCVYAVDEPNAISVTAAQVSHPKAQKFTPPAFQGCYLDAVDRDLPKLGRGDGPAVSREEAKRLCAGYKFYSIQYKNQVFCGNTFGKHGMRNDCKCSDSSDVGAWRNCVYAIEEPATVALPSPFKGCFKDAADRDLTFSARKGGSVVTREEAQKLCAAYKYYSIQFDQQVFCGDSFGKHGSASDCQCDSQNVGAWRNCVYSVPEAPSVSVVSTSPFLGCHVDAGDRDLPFNARGEGATPTRAQAQQMCKGYKYYGIQYKNQVFCGNSFSKHGAASDCKCDSATNVGAWRNCVYKVEDVPPSLPVPTPTAFRGCFKDENTRDLPHMARGAQNSPVTRAQARAACAGYKHYGIQATNEIWCGNSFGKYGAAYDCTCSSTSSVGAWRNCVFDVDEPVVGAFAQRVTYGESQHLMCKPGFSVDGSAAGTRDFTATCMSTGEFSQAGARCQKISCGAAPTIANADLKGSKRLVFGDTASYACKPGYTAGGVAASGLVYKTVSGRTCQRWAWQKPHAHGTKGAHGVNHCQALGKQDKPWCFTTDPATRWEFCPDVGDTNATEFSVSCGIEGGILGAKECLPVACGAAPATAHATPAEPTRNFVFGDSASYQCEAGHSADGTPTGPTAVGRACGADGSFAALPGCKKIDYCHENKCGKSGRCVSGRSAYICDCELGYEAVAAAGGGQQCVEIDECVDARGAVKCGEEQGAGKCVDGIGKYTCDCKPGYEEAAAESGGQSCMAKMCGYANPITNAAEPRPRAGSKIFFPSTISYSCLAGHTTTGKVTGAKTFVVTCDTSGKLQGAQECKPVECGAPLKVDHAKYATEALTHRQIVSYQCDKGFTVDGTPTGDTTFSSRCLEDGTFTQVQQCMPVSCGAAPAVAFATGSQDAHTTGQEVTYTCATGYTTTGEVAGKASFALQCTDAGVYWSQGWNDLARKDCKAQDVGQGSMAGTCAFPFVHAGKVFESCATGEGVFGAAWCRVAGKPLGWGGCTDKCVGAMAEKKLPSCRAVSCGVPSQVENADVFAPANLRYKEQIEIVCQAGYTTDGKASGHNSFVRQCQSNGELTKNHQCKPVSCGVPAATATAAPAETTPLFFGQEVVYKCAKGYSTDGQPSGGFACDAMDETAGTCTASVKHGTSKSFRQRCDSGGALVAGSPGTCVPVDFCQPMNPCGRNGQCSTLFSTEGAGVGYKCSCMKGYEPTTKNGVLTCGEDDCAGHTCGPGGSCMDLKGDYTCECSAGHSMIITASGEKTCARDACSEKNALAAVAPDVAHASFTITRAGVDTPTVSEPNAATLFVGDIAVYTCGEGFSVDGSAAAAAKRFSVQCEDTGYFSPVGQCQKVLCDEGKLQTVAHATVDKGSRTLFAFGDIVTYTCAAGFSTDGTTSGAKSFDLGCGADGQFDSPSVCEPVLCGSCDDIPADRKGFATCPAGNLRAGQAKTLSCFAGYELSDRSTTYDVTCGADGKFSYPEDTSCVPSSCGPVPEYAAARVVRPGEGSSLHPGMALDATQTPQLTSENGRYFVVVTTGGLTLFDKILHGEGYGGVLWEAKPGSVDQCVMGADGSLTLVDASGSRRWSSQVPTAGSRAVVQNDGNFVQYSPDGVGEWHTETYVHDMIADGTFMKPWHRLTSRNGQYYAIVQTDGNFVVYARGQRRSLWATDTHGSAVAGVQFVGGHMAVCEDRACSKRLWGAAPGPHPGSKMVMQDDGNLVVYNKEGRPLWATHTVQTSLLQVRHVFAKARATDVCAGRTSDNFCFGNGEPRVVPLVNRCGCTCDAGYEGDFCNRPVFQKRSLVLQEGRELRALSDVTVEECQAACLQRQGCNSFTYGGERSCSLRDQCVSPTHLAVAESTSFHTYFRPCGFRGQTLTYQCAQGATTTGAADGPRSFTVDVTDTCYSPAAACQRVGFTVSGRVNHAATAASIPGARVCIGASCAVTNEAGVYQLVVGRGAAELVAEMEGFVRFTQTIRVEGDIVPGQQGDIPMAPVLGPGEMRVVLSWNEHPSDLDSHAFFGDSTDACHLCWYNTNVGYCRRSGGATAILERDVVSGYGPEVTHLGSVDKCDSLQKNRDCRLVFKIKDYSKYYGEAVGLGDSGAVVKVYKGNAVAAEYKVDTALGGATWWPVFTLDLSNGEIHTGEVSIEDASQFLGPAPEWTAATGAFTLKTPAGAQLKHGDTTAITLRQEDGETPAGLYTVRADGHCLTDQGVWGPCPLVQQALEGAAQAGLCDGEVHMVRTTYAACLALNTGADGTVDRAGLDGDFELKMSDSLGLCAVKLCSSGRFRVSGLHSCSVGATSQVLLRAESTACAAAGGEHVEGSFCRLSLCAEDAAGQNTYSVAEQGQCKDVHATVGLDHDAEESQFVLCRGPIEHPPASTLWQALPLSGESRVQLRSQASNVCLRGAPSTASGADTSPCQALDGQPAPAGTTWSRSYVPADQQWVVLEAYESAAPLALTQEASTVDVTGQHGSSEAAVAEQEEDEAQDDDGDLEADSEDAWPQDVDDEASADVEDDQEDADDGEEDSDEDLLL